MKAERKHKIQVIAILTAASFPLWGGIAELHAQNRGATQPPAYLSTPLLSTLPPSAVSLPILSVSTASGNETLPSATLLADSRQSPCLTDFDFDIEERSLLGARGTEGGEGNSQKMPVNDGLYIGIFLAVAYGIVKRIGTTTRVAPTGYRQRGG
jgi:hypothetical protein